MAHPTGANSTDREPLSRVTRKHVGVRQARGELPGDCRHKRFHPFQNDRALRTSPNPATANPLAAGSSLGLTVNVEPKQEDGTRQRSRPSHVL